MPTAVIQTRGIGEYNCLFPPDVDGGGGGGAARAEGAANADESCAGEAGANEVAGADGSCVCGICAGPHRANSGTLSSSTKDDLDRPPTLTVVPVVPVASVVPMAPVLVIPVAPISTYW